MQFVSNKIIYETDVDHNAVLICQFETMIWAFHGVSDYLFPKAIQFAMGN